ncbi:unnamed protein product, partial [Nesidiocoris tenuis]
MPKGQSASLPEQIGPLAARHSQNFIFRSIPPNIQGFFSGKRRYGISPYDTGNRHISSE